ncbi:hypothetical protein AXG93_399s1290 [Marchantia polymorpha subsp. ruderalis]|uniref:Uncharacterized protein n=1 Tax=Marchantia polymorpha subsp. ruderalis TaxID=1480154 RepID=A0A176WI78_MARPO|nr:hypothetical protein AXG93_399s1290 [Marchantia polymorpha subsp. ruderalis]
MALGPHRPTRREPKEGRKEGRKEGGASRTGEGSGDGVLGSLCEGRGWGWLALVPGPVGSGGLIGGCARKAVFYSGVGDDSPRGACGAMLEKERLDKQSLGDSGWGPGPPPAPAPAPPPPRPAAAAGRWSSRPSVPVVSNRGLRCRCRSEVPTLRGLALRHHARGVRMYTGAAEAAAEAEEEEGRSRRTDRVPEPGVCAGRTSEPRKHHASKGRSVFSGLWESERGILPREEDKRQTGAMNL